MRSSVRLLRWPVVAIALVACGVAERTGADAAFEEDATALTELSGLDAPEAVELAVLGDAQDVAPVGADEVAGVDLPTAPDGVDAVDVAWQPGIPPIDLEAPEGLQTATFSLG